MTGDRQTDRDGSFAAVAPTAAILVGSGASSALLSNLALAINAVDPVDAVVSALSAEGLRRLPAFACAIREDNAVRLFAHGAVTVTVTSRDSARVVIEADGMSTWAEQVVVDPIEVALRLLPASGAPSHLKLLSNSLDVVSGARLDGAEVPDISTPSVNSDAASEASDAMSEAVVEEDVVKDSDTMVLSDELVDALSIETTVLGDEIGGSDVALPGAAVDEAPDFDFAHLLEETHYRSVEAAAVREPDGSEKEGETDDGNHDGNAVAGIAAAGTASEGLTSSAMPSSISPQGIQVPTKPIAWETSDSGLIESVPWSTATSADRNPDRGASAGTSAGATATGPSVGQSRLGDHDGETVSLKSLRASLAADMAPETGQAPLVQSVHCASGHPNAPHADRCRSCAGQITDRTASLVPRPSLGRLRFADGMLVEVDRPLLLGRRPTHDTSRTINGEVPGLVLIPDPGKALSRIHVEVRLEDWQVLVVDRNSVNGTFVEIPGHSMMKLRPDEACLITAASRVNLGDVASFTYEVPAL